MRSFGRLSGVLLPLFSLRSRTDLGIGDFGGLPGLFAWMQAAKQRMLMLLPLLPTAPGDSSPYSCRSAFGLNPLFIDLEQVPEHRALGGEASFSEDERRKLDEARRSPRIRYDLVFPLKYGALRRAFDRFEQEHGSKNDARAQEFSAYCREQADWLDSFALYTAISADQQQRAWWEWPAELRDRNPEALAKEKDRLAREVRYQQWLQWVAETQWRNVREQAKAKGVLLCGDEPFIIGQDSADCWANPTLLRRDARLGVPPDDFSADGQDWGLPYFDFARMQRDDFAWLKFRARKSAAYYDTRRVDHAVGYFRQWIRDQETPKGRFIPRDEALHPMLGERNFKLLSEEAGIIAEDLGVIPPYVRQILTRLQIPGYRVMRWERDGLQYRDPRQYPTLSLATTGTHDTSTLREWWETAPDEERQAVAKVYVELQPHGAPRAAHPRGARGADRRGDELRERSGDPPLAGPARHERPDQPPRLDRRDELVVPDLPERGVPARGPGDEARRGVDREAHRTGPALEAEHSVHPANSFLAPRADRG